MVQYGRTWWGSKWLGAFNGIDDTNRLPRGRTYANKGAVRDVVINQTSIDARVQGSRRLPYKVAIALEPLSKKAVDQIGAMIKKSPSMIALLINRRLPENLLDILQKLDMHLFPGNWKDINARCSCPDSAVPCKHIAAVIYLVAGEIDKNPFLVFSLRGCDLDQVIASFNQTHKITDTYPIASLEDILEASSPKHTFFDPQLLATIDFSIIPNLKDQIACILTPNPLFYRSDFKSIMTTVYQYGQKSFSVREKLPNTDDDVASDEQWRGAERWKTITLVIDEIGCCQAVCDGSKKLFLDKKQFSMALFVQFLDSLSISYATRLCSSVRLLHVIHQFVIKILHQAAYIPQVLTLKNGDIFVRWIPALFDPTVNKVYKQLCLLCPDTLLCYGNKKTKHYPGQEQQILAICSVMLGYYIANNMPASLDKYQSDKVMQLFFKGGAYSFDQFGSAEIPVTIAIWLSRLHLYEKTHKIYLIVTESAEKFLLHIDVEYQQQGVATLVGLHKALKKNANCQTSTSILSDLALLCEYIPELIAFIDSQKPIKVGYNYQNFTEIFLNILPVLRSIGITVVLPKALQKMLKPRLRLALRADDEHYDETVSFLSLDKVLSFNWKIALGDDLVGVDEFKKILHASQGIVKLKDQYVLFDEQEMKTLLKQLASLPERLSNAELMQAVLSGTVFDDIQITSDVNVQHLLEKISHYKPVTVPDALKADLRPYQERGFSWLVQNIAAGFGSILADDMGLGKTLQVITCLLHLKMDGYLHQQKVLIVVPTGLLVNWQREMARFAPDLHVMLYHGQQRDIKNCTADIILTSYGVVRQDKMIFTSINWFLVIIDEAQNIKNYSSEQTKAIKQLKAQHKIAMSGTPVENRLLEYWSIFDFVNKGYLGSTKHFNSAFVIPIEKDRDSACLIRFNKITNPFILRRLKSDKNIIHDLPDKIERDCYVHLTAEQTALYQQIVNVTMHKIEHSAGIERKGLIFSLINDLKQVCNHPSHYAQKNNANIEQSGKMKMLVDILVPINESGEKVLIFTQYVEMGNLIAKMLEERFGLSVPFLHGGLSIKQRDNLVNEFQHENYARVLIISLKAGGTGLNLTAANHVIHYDLWWNPAVESQATDRAYRIGQHKNVMVYRLLAINTFEERINDMIKRKKELANLTVSSGEQWITEFDDVQLQNLFALTRDGEL